MLSVAAIALPGVRQLDYAGSLRRGRETIGDLDFLVSYQLEVTPLGIGPHIGRRGFERLR